MPDSNQRPPVARSLAGFLFFSWSVALLAGSVSLLAASWLRSRALAPSEELIASLAVATVGVVPALVLRIVLTDRLGAGRAGLVAAVAFALLCTGALLGVREWGDLPLGLPSGLVGGLVGGLMPFIALCTLPNDGGRVGSGLSGPR